MALLNSEYHPNQSLQKCCRREKYLKNDLNQYITREYQKLDSEMEQREFLERMRFLMMAKDKDFSDYYSTRNLARNEFYSVMDTLYELNNLCMLSEFIHQNRQILFQEVNEGLESQKLPDFTEICRFGKDTMLSRMFQVMQEFHNNEGMVSEDVTYIAPEHRLKIYAASAQKGRREVPQIVLQGNWVENWGFTVGSTIRVECHQNKLVILKE